MLVAAPRRNLAPAAFDTLSDKRTLCPSARRLRENARARVLPMKCEISGLKARSDFGRLSYSPSPPRSGLSQGVPVQYQREALRFSMWVSAKATLLFKLCRMCGPPQFGSPGDVTHPLHG